MKYILATALMCQSVGAFAPTLLPQHATSLKMAKEYTPMDGEGKINLKVELDSVTADD